MPFLFLSHVFCSILIDWQIFKGEQFDWFAWISHSTLRNIVNSFRWSITIQFNFKLIMFGMCKTKRSSKCKQCLFTISKIDIIWSNRITSKFINYQLWASYKIFLSLKYLFHFSLTNCWLHFFTRVLRSNFMEL